MQTLNLLDTATFFYENSGTKVNVMRFLLVCFFISSCEIYFNKTFIKDINY
jgi:hypothetical protein